MIYRVTKQFSTGSEQPCQQFKTLQEAKVYALDSASKNAALKIKVVYRVYEFDDIMETYDSAKVGDEAQSSSAATTGGKSSGSSFQPTPFATAPRPSGLPHNWVKDSDNKEDK